MRPLKPGGRARLWLRQLLSRRRVLPAFEGSSVPPAFELSQIFSFVHYFSSQSPGSPFIPLNPSSRWEPSPEPWTHLPRGVPDGAATAPSPSYLWFRSEQRRPQETCDCSFVRSARYVGAGEVTRGGSWPGSAVSSFSALGQGRSCTHRPVSAPGGGVRPFPLGLEGVAHTQCGHTCNCLDRAVLSSVLDRVSHARDLLFPRNYWHY